MPDNCLGNDTQNLTSGGGSAVVGDVDRPVFRDRDTARGNEGHGDLGARAVWGNPDEASPAEDRNRIRNLHNVKTAVRAEGDINDVREPRREDFRIPALRGNAIDLGDARGEWAASQLSN